jgi:hypothetical protein
MKRSAFQAGMPKTDLQTGFRVFRNPAKDFITLQFHGSHPSAIQYSFYSVSGTLLKSGFVKTDEYMSVTELQ